MLLMSHKKKQLEWLLNVFYFIQVNCRICVLKVKEVIYKNKMAILKF
jgi:hypothetical protein